MVLCILLSVRQTTTVAGRTLIEYNVKFGLVEFFTASELSSFKNDSYPGSNTVRSKHFTKQSKRYASLFTAFVSRAKEKREARTGNTARRPERVIPEIISEKYRIVVPWM